MCENLESGYQELFNKEIIALQEVFKICITEVSSGFLFNLDPTVKDGIIIPIGTPETFRMIIFIDESMTYEKKLRVLYHEYGHACHNLNLGLIELLRRQELNTNEWKVEEEFEAMRFCLIKSKEIAEKGNIDFLRNTIDDMNNQTACEYVDAVERIRQEQIWKECNLLIANE